MDENLVAGLDARDIETQEYVTLGLELALAQELLDQNMGTADIKRAFEDNQAKISVADASLAYQNNKQTITLTGTFPDGAPFQFTTAPFDGCPVEKAKQLATDLTMPAPAQLRGLAATLREQLQQAINRANKIGENAKSEVGNLHQVLDTAQEVVTDVKAASQEIQSALGMGTNGGPPLDGAK